MTAPLRSRRARLTLAAIITSAAAATHGFELMGSRWPEPTTRIFADLVLGGPASPTGVLWNDAFQEAAGLWSTATPFAFDLIEERSDPCAGVLVSAPEDGFRNGVGFAPDDCGLRFGAGTLAVTTVYSRAGVTTEADIVFNEGAGWDVYRGPWQSWTADFRRVAAHELGHVLGLDHEDDTPALMASLIAPGTEVESPLEDDVNGVLALYGPHEPLEPLSPIVLRLEEPAPAEAKAGISNLRGWVVSRDGIDRIELHLDGIYQGLIPFGGPRPDVATVFPEYPGSRDSGFSLAFNYGNLSAGAHRVTVRAFDQLGEIAEASAGFEVLRFDSAFVPDPDSVDETWAQAEIESGGVRIRNLLVQGRWYEILLQWRTASQTYEIVELRRLD